MSAGVVYLLHFDPPYKHARHYLGYCGRADLTARIVEHTTGRGARLVEVAHNAGVVLTLARTWDGGRDLERQLKRRKDTPRLCPVCNPGTQRGSRYQRPSLLPTRLLCEPPF